MSAEQDRVLFAELERKGTVREALEGLFDYLLRCCPGEALRSSARANVSSWSEALRTPAFRKGFARSRQQVEAALVSLIQQGIQRGELADSLAPEAAAGAILAAIFGVQLQVALVDGLNAPGLLSTTRDLVVGGLPWRD